MRPSSEINSPSTGDLICESITKSYRSNLAVDEVSVSFRPGEIHAILGENGSGKSTLAKIIAGEIFPDFGKVIVGGQKVKSRHDARKFGIQLVHQNLSLVEALSVSENFILEMPKPNFWPNVNAIGKSIEDAAKRYGLNLKSNMPVASLSMSERQWLEIFRAIYLGSQIIILDEPTSLLSPIESNRLFENISSLAKHGKTIILITHKLDEVFNYSHRVSILQRGRILVTSETNHITRNQITNLLTDSKLNNSCENSFSVNDFELKSPILELIDINLKSQEGIPLLKNVSISIYQGKITGVAGVAGNGQTELAEIVAGIRRSDSGIIKASSEESFDRRYVPADRYQTGSSSDLSILEVISARLINKNSAPKSASIDWNSLSTIANKQVKDFRVKIRSLNDRPGALSGGNLQKVILARELEGPPKLLVAHNPTSGLDISTSDFIRDEIRKASTLGTSVLLISDDLEELFFLSDEIYVLFENSVSGHLPRREFDYGKIASMMMGGIDESLAI